MKTHSPFPYARWTNHSAGLVAANQTTPGSANSSNGVINAFCECLGNFEHLCVKLQEPPAPVNSLLYNSDVGRTLYTIAILSLFALVILLLMVRSIKRSSATIEVETLLESMRFRAELDIQHRQRRRLQKAKNKVTAWLTRTNPKTWQSSPQILLPDSETNLNNPKPQRSGKAIRNDSMQSSITYLPEIVISNSDDVFLHKRQNSCTPSLSLLYDFGDRSRKNSANFSETSDTIDLSQFSDFSYPEPTIDQNPVARSPRPFIGSQLSLNVMAGSLGTRSI